MKLTITISAGVVAAILGYLLWPVGQKTSALDHVASAEGRRLQNIEAVPFERICKVSPLGSNSLLEKTEKRCSLQPSEKSIGLAETWAEVHRNMTSASS